MLLATNLLVHKGFGWAVKTDLQAWIQALPFMLELLLIVLVVDLVQYWTHRADHETRLWRLHAVHHSQDKEALDTNYAAHFALLDYLFGTAAKSDKIWPEQYGMLGDYVPNRFWAHLKFSFTWKG
jgi:sterol desaturase/sphingolipid hydroxylase (fatty acid hydroxylase superfamily)